MKDTITINDFFEIAKQTDLKDLLDKYLYVLFIELFFL